MYLATLNDSGGRFCTQSLAHHPDTVPKIRPSLHYMHILDKAVPRLIHCTAWTQSNTGNLTEYIESYLRTLDRLSSARPSNRSNLTNDASSCSSQTSWEVMKNLIWERGRGTVRHVSISSPVPSLVPSVSVRLLKMPATLPHCQSLDRAVVPRRLRSLRVSLL
jgi:hypothetical protein